MRIIYLSVILLGALFFMMGISYVGVYSILGITTGTSLMVLGYRLMGE